jgi:hypothetical protein
MGCPKACRTLPIRFKIKIQNIFFCNLLTCHVYTEIIGQSFML